VIGLALACLAARLVFEIGLLNYYFLAVAVLFLLCDFLQRRPPWRAVAWIVVTRFGVTWLAPRGPSWLTAAAFGLSALAALATGMATVARLPSAVPRHDRAAPVSVA